MIDSMIISMPQGSQVQTRIAETLVVLAGALGPQGPQGIQGPQGPFMTTGGTGVVVETAPSTFAARTIVGAANRITVTNGNGVAGNPTIDISAAYVGQNTITTLGTVTVGTWAADFPGGGSVNSTGEMGVRTAPSTIVALTLGLPSSNATALYGVNATGTLPSTTTASWYSYRSVVTTTNSAFTLGELTHFYALGAAKGAASTITSARGFYASNSLAVGVNNYGFYSDINAAANTWQLYMAGTAQSRFQGPVGILTNPSTSLLNVGGSATHPDTGTAPLGITVNYTIPSTATASPTGLAVVLSTQNAVFTTTVRGIEVGGFTRGAASTITTVYGFMARNSLAVGTTNYGFWADIAEATNTYAVYSSGTATSFFAGRVGIGEASVFGGFAMLGVGSLTHIDPSVTLYGVAVDIIAPATATSRLAINRAVARTTATAFTIGNIEHFYAETVILGSGSSITNVRGFYAGSGIAGSATNTYGFYTDLNAGSNVFAYYAVGTAPSLFAGSTGIGVGSTVAAASLRIGITAQQTNTTVHYVQADGGTLPSSATGQPNVYYAGPVTTNSVFTTTAFTLFNAATVTKGGSHTITSMYGFRAQNAIAVGTNNYGFYSDIAQAGTTWQLYMAGTGESYFAAPVGIGNNAPLSVGTWLRVGVASNPSTAASVSGIAIDSIAPSTATTAAYGVYSVVRTVAAVFTLTSAVHFRADTIVKNAGSTITSAYGFWAANGLAVGNTNYGFFSDINVAANTYQLYMSGTAPSYFGGYLGLMTAPDSTVILRIGPVAHPSTATTIYGIGTDIAAPSTATASFHVNLTAPRTVASAFTLAAMNHYIALSVVKGAGSTITTMRGFYAANAIAVGTNNYGFYSDINSAANTFQLNMAGSALSQFTGGVILNSTAAPTVVASQIGLGATTATTVGAAGGASALPATPSGYWIINVAGTQMKVPYYAN